ncbi:serine/threonine protein kinase [Candidatus Obscuribacterales bacterium]|nr:serine/threonine protein kinase [Candidatus Obscuribacterales bacterium]MBX3138979.1 serine/threonine protein kinase [Candidatus Obscuribacterales bacterium]MBX3152896.1 serine/threonine protein kinase [Candidatus Obscuribacterales bacterium]
MSDEIKVGTTINSKYELLAVLGKGRNSTVYKGYQHFAKKSVALKILDASDIEKATEELKRFQHEARVSAQLAAHQGIVDVFDFGAAGAGQVFLVMNLIEGLTLRELISQKGRLDAALASDIFKQIANALAFVHEQKIIHLGLDPSEIILTPASSKDKETYKVTVVDFGSAVQLSEVKTAITTPQESSGKPGYMSPEQQSGEDVDARSDIYTVGRMMYETLTGSLPESVLTFPADLQIPENIQEAIAKSTDADKNKRFQSMKEFAQKLQGSDGPDDKKKDVWGWTKKIFK